MLIIDKIYILVNLISSWKGLVNKYRKEYMAIHLLLLFFLPSLDYSYLTLLQHPNKQKQINYTRKYHVYVLYDNINPIPRLHIQTLNFQGSFSLYYAWSMNMRRRLHGTSPSAMFPGVLPPSPGGILRQTPAGTVPGITEDTGFYIPKKKHGWTGFANKKHAAQGPWKGGNASWLERRQTALLL